MGADGSADAQAHPWRASVAQVLVADLEAPELDEADRTHLARALRLDDGEVVCVTDGRGGWRLCRWQRGRLVPDSPVDHEPARDNPITVGFAPVKGDRPDWAVQKLTEVGADVIVLLRTERSVVRWDDERGARQLARLERIAAAASAQCRRLWLPELRLGVPAELPAAVLADAGGRPLGSHDHAVLVGPEGGWTNDEREGRELIGLGEHVLRAETAAVLAGAAMVSLQLGLTRPGLT